MKKIFVIEKLGSARKMYLQILQDEIFWNENIRLASLFSKEDDATARILLLPSEENDCFFQIQKIYQKIN